MAGDLLSHTAGGPKPRCGRGPPAAAVHRTPGPARPRQAEPVTCLAPKPPTGRSRPRARQGSPSPPAEDSSGAAAPAPPRQAPCQASQAQTCHGACNSLPAASALLLA